MTSLTAVFDESYCRYDQCHLMARVYRPAGDGPFPTLLSVHGGAWNAGTRRTNASLDKAVAACGILVFAVDFRQPPAARYPASIADIHLAARWARENASRFGGRDERIGGLGTSSGGHQLLLNALRPTDPRYGAPVSAETTPVFEHLALCWPIVDPLERYRWAQRNNLRKLMRMHEKYWGDQAAMADGNPQAILDAGELDPRALPDLLVVQGAADENIPAGMTERFVDGYRLAGGNADLRIFDDMPHGFITRDVARPESVGAISLIVNFVTHHSAKESTP